MEKLAKEAVSVGFWSNHMPLLHNVIRRGGGGNAVFLALPNSDSISFKN